MAYATQTRLVFCYDNFVSPEYVNTVALTNITPELGFPANNLLYPDPRLIMRTAATVAHPNNRVITFNFLTAQSIGCAGIAAHDLMSRGYETLTVEWSDNGSAWTNVQTATTQALGTYNMNFFVRFDETSHAWWRLTLGKASGTRPIFEIGMIFLGRWYALSRNAVVDGGFITRHTVPLYIIDTAGGDRLALPTPRRLVEDTEISLSRIAQFDRLWLQQRISAANAGRIVGIIPPSEVTTQIPVYEPHLYGYIQEDVSAVRMAFPYPQYDATFRFMGAT